MKKFASALAVAAVVAVPSLAQAQGPQIYGLVHTSLEHFDNGDDTGHALVARQSHVGLRGAMPIASPRMLAIYQLQTSIDTAQGGGTLLGQDSWVGLRGGLGMIRIGHIAAPSTVLAYRVGLFRDQIGDARNGFRSNTNFDLRVGNAIAYAYEAGPVGVDLYYVTNFDTPAYNGGAATESDEAMYGIGINYADGPLYVGATYERHEDQFGVLGATPVDRTAALRDAESFRIGASYRMGQLRISGMAEHGNQYAPLALDPNTGLPTGAVFGGGESTDHLTIGGGAAYTIDRFTIKAQAYHTDVDSDDYDLDSTLFAVGLDYALGDNTNVYLNYASVSNGDDATQGNWQAGAISPGSLEGMTPAPGETSSALALGLVHRF